MRNKREHIRQAVVLLLTVAGLIICTTSFSASSGLAYAQAAAPTWSYTSSLNVARSGYTATLLPNGKVSELKEFNGNYIRAEMVRAFISSIEYRRRFGQP